jgi:SAM-dependent methyltransferase
MVASSEEAESFPRRDLELGFCRSCGFIQNVLFDPGVHRYSPDYEETQAFSPRFQEFLREMCADQIERHDLHGKDVLEIGCGKGEFLVELCEQGGNRGIGIDPGYRPERTQSDAASRIRFIQDFYSTKYADLTADYVACRHTLEHIQPVREFVREVRRTLDARRDAVVFFELPDVERVLREGAFWDIYYEHCTYFTLGSLARLFRSCGFDVLDLATGFDDQYLLIVARPGDGTGGTQLAAEQDLAAVTAAVKSFRSRVPSAISDWRSRLSELAQAGKRAVLWGSGSKAVAFLTTLGIRDEVRYVVDINPHKHGMYLAGTGQLIVAPAFLTEYQPDLIILMNPIYRDEVRSDCLELGVQAELVALEGS